MATEDLEWERSKISNQDMNLLKRLGFTKKKDALRFPHEESYPSPPMEYRLHQLTPNSILHVSIFITLCECFLGVQPNRALWKRIFCLRRNGSHGVAYNIGGAIICVSDVDYFDVKFPDSVQGWRKRWLYVHEESSDSMEYNIAPFDGKTKILRRRSWDAEATEEEKLATEVLITRIRELQSTRGKELSGIQITAYFLRIRMQPLQARKKSPLDVCWVTLFYLLFLPSRGGEVEERVVVTDDNQGASRPEVESGVPRNPRLHLKKRMKQRFPRRHAHLSSLLLQRAKGKGMKLSTLAPPKLILPVLKRLHPMREETLDLYDAALVSSDDEEEDAPIDETARTSTSRTLVVSEARPDGDKTSPPPQNPERPTPAISPQAPSPKRARVESTKEPTILVGCSSTSLMEEPFMKELVRFGTQFIGYRDYAGELEEKLAEANRRADALAIELEQSERRTHQEYELENPEDDELLDALSLLEIHGTEARNGLAEAEAGLSRLFPYFFHKKEEPAVFIDLAKCFTGNEDLGLQLRQEGLKVGVEGTMALVAESQQQVDWSRVGDTGKIETKKWQSLIKAAKPNSKKILATLGYKPAPAPSSSKPEVK
ncbi:hypothetical protein QYE76_063004 [Lolium multiflorum]|uniref:Transposase (putative) gypsy type domain-containing protein n=1 Tax=Lolium multiflorum TaxID=4521 RepID=A0AAD8W8N2_LOLMU|nr:hypothetical protein QYE76_063004 [Lolium multiflorum]